MSLTLYIQFVNDIDTLLNHTNSKFKLKIAQKMCVNFKSLISEGNQTSLFIKQVCSLSGCTPEELPLKTKKPKIVMARQFIMAYDRLVIGKSLENAAMRFNKDHSTTSHSCRKIHDLYQVDKHFREQFRPVFEKYPELIQE